MFGDGRILVSSSCLPTVLFSTVHPRCVFFLTSLSLSLFLSLSLSASQRAWTSEAPEPQYYVKRPKVTPSSSDRSKFPYAETMSNTVLWVETSIPGCCFECHELYDLKELGEMFKPVYHAESAQCCKELLTSIIKREDIEIAVEDTQPRESTITDLICTRDQRPYLSLHLKDDVTAQTIVEIWVHHNKICDCSNRLVASA